MGASLGGDGDKATAQANEPEPEQDLREPTVRGDTPPKIRGASDERIQWAAKRAAVHFTDGAAVYVYQDQGPWTGEGRGLLCRSQQRLSHFDTTLDPLDSIYNPKKIMNYYRCRDL